MANYAKEQIKVEFQIEPEEAWALAQLCKRLALPEATELSGPNERPRLILLGLQRLRDALARQGFYPR